MQAAPSPSQNYVVQALIFAAVAVALLLLWQLTGILLLVFASLVFASVIWSIAEPLEKFTPLNHRVSLGVAALIIAVIVGSFGYLFGVQLFTELTALLVSLPERISDAGAMIGVPDMDRRLSNFLSGFADNDGFFASIARYTSGFFGIVAGTVLVVVGGLYLVLDIRRYRAGLLTLIPDEGRAKAGNVLDKVGRALRLWLLGQLVAMVVVGVATGLGLYLLGIPSALALGFLAGLLEFVPFVGPILAYAAALVLSLGEGLTAALWVTLLYVVLQQVESNLLVPLVQQRTVDLPPALGLFALVAFGVLLGPMGILLGVPLTVVIMVAVKQLYVRDVLKEETTVPGEDDEDKAREEAAQHVAKKPRKKASKA